MGQPNTVHLCWKVVITDQLLHYTTHDSCLTNGHIKLRQADDLKYCVWRLILKLCLTCISRHCAWSQPDTHQMPARYNFFKSGVRRPPDARRKIQNHASDVIFCDHASDMQYVIFCDHAPDVQYESSYVVRFLWTSDMQLQSYIILYQ